MKTQIKITLNSPKLNFEVFVEKKENVLNYLKIFLDNKNCTSFLKRLIKDFEIYLNTKPKKISFIKNVGNTGLKVKE